MVMSEDSESKYISMRVPKTEYKKLKDARDQLKKNPDYSWVESLALGAFIGLLAGYALKKISESDNDRL